MEVSPTWDQPWPPSELQAVPLCPVCECPKRSILREGLVDNVFFVAQGRWTLHQCERCKSAYLDPRPNEASIGKAYGTYYTHVAGGGQNPTSELSTLRRLRRRVANGYVNRRFGTQRQPASNLGAVLLASLPSIRHRLDAKFRFLPRPRPGQSLLDVGCGNGGFLCNAAEAGWTVSGVDPDLRALAAASSLGFDIRQGGIEAFAEERDRFDAVTLSHVIEHLHDPAKVIRAAYRLLKPGGILYIDTPNIQSHGLTRFGSKWRGLETPRHLVLFSRDGLANLLIRSGFQELEFKRRSAVRVGMAIRSLRMQRGLSPYDKLLSRLPWRLRLGTLMPRAVNHDEFLTVIAFKEKR